MSEPAPASDSPQAAKKVLVIDDVAELRELVQSVLEGEGFTVDVAQDPTLGALKLVSHKPDLVILDLNMPGVDGFRFVEYVREFMKPPPFVFLSGGRNLEAVLRGVALGAFAFLPKPVNFTQLVETCRAALAKAEAGSGTARAPEEERRAHPRHSVLVQVQLMRQGNAEKPKQHVEGDTGKGVMLAEMTDLSAGGGRVISVAQFPIGSRLHVVPDPKVVHGPKSLIGEVRSNDMVETGFQHGLQFVDLDPEVERLLRDYLSPG